MLIQIDEVAEETYWLQLQINGAPSAFTIYVIKENGGVVIEPGPSALIPGILKALSQLGMSDLQYIIPTHIHMDHAGASGELSQLFPEAKIVVHPQGAKHIIDPSQLIQSTRMAHGDGFETIYGTIAPVLESRIKIVKDEEKLILNNRELMVIYTPGHASHHIAIFDSKTKGLYCGEALGVPTLSSFFEFQLLPAALPGFDADAYMNSIERVRKLKPGILYYSHSKVSYEPEKLMDRVAENTKILTETVLNALKTEATNEAVNRRIYEFIWRYFGVKLEDFYLEMTVNGYAIYFKRKGLL